MMSPFKTVNVQREIRDPFRRVPLLIYLCDLSILSDRSAFDTHTRPEDSVDKSCQPVVHLFDLFNILPSYPSVFPI